MFVGCLVLYQRFTYPRQCLTHIGMKLNNLTLLFSMMAVLA